MHGDPPLHDYRGIGKHVISAVFAVFMGYNPRFVVPRGFSMHGDPLYTTIEVSTKLVISAVFWRLRGL